MHRRCVLVVVIGLLLTGCVNSERLRSNLGGPRADSKAGADPKTQTLASKVLGAIALEAVTDRKPDPARLNELH
jgi:hypothetical protein